MGEENRMKVETISELVADEKLFDSRGWTTLKVTKDGKEKPYRMPIKSTGVAEYQAELEGLAPKPPRTTEVIKKGSPEGRAMGLKHNELTYVLDLTDEEYIDALDKHSQGFIWRVAVFALDIKWTKKDGTQATTFEEKKAILQGNNISGHHIDKIFADVNALTQFQGDREDFLSGS